MISIPEFYAHKHIFVTGATGFVGKVLLEKLLRCCPDVGSVYCLIRPKRGKTAEERLEIILQERLFEVLKRDHPGVTDKVHAVHGDIIEEGLGISDANRQMLQERVNVVFHSAATVRFDEPLKLAVELNVIGVKRMVEICRRFQKLEAFVHVSTAYANCDRTHIDEIIYPPLVEPNKVINAIEWMSDEMVDLITPKILGTMPNTYTFTKQLGESLLIDEGSEMPLAIVRPSIVTATWKEPIPGWVDNVNGPSGLCIATGKGLLRSMVGDTRVIADITPVDLPVNMMLAVGWYTAVHKPKQNGQVYHSTTGGLNPVTWGETENIMSSYFKKNPLDSCFRRPQLRILTQNSMLNDLWRLVSHLIPAHAMDLVYRLMGKKPRMVAIYNKLHKACSTMEYFTMREWEWTHSNMELLKHQLNSEDQKTFYFDPRGLHWPTYIENYCMGTKKFILKEDLSDLPAARAHLRKLRNIRYMFNTISLVVLWRLLIARSNLARNSWFFVMGLVFKFVRFFRLTSTLPSS